MAVLLGCQDYSSNKDVEEGSARYKVTFSSVWSEMTHPLNFPGNPHFSGLIGGTHNVNVILWKEGEVATPGIEGMAETGSKATLQVEIQSQIDVGDADSIISGAGIGASPGEVSVIFDASPHHAYLSLVSMLAPSPDWFVGVSAINLLENGVWVESKTIDLVVYDAGTDDGSEYTSSNQDSSPKQPISTITSPPFLIDGEVKPVGQFVISKISP